MICQCFSKLSVCIICAALLRCVALFYECSREYSKAAAKWSLKEIKTSFLRDVAFKFGLSFNKFSFNLVAWTDMTGAFKIMTIKFSYNWQFYERCNIITTLRRISLENNIHSTTAIASRLFWTSLTWFSWSLEYLRNLFLNFVIQCSW